MKEISLEMGAYKEALQAYQAVSAARMSEREPATPHTAASPTPSVAANGVLDSATSLKGEGGSPKSSDARVIELEKASVFLKAKLAETQVRVPTTQTVCPYDHIEGLLWDVSRGCL
jgi:hypothetical protein